jgi:hypothetical protein
VTGTADSTGPALALTTISKFTKTPAQTISGTVSDLNGVAGVQVQIDGLAVNAATVTGGTWTFNVPAALIDEAAPAALAPKIHTVAVTANDIALTAPVGGNLATPVSSTIVLDTTLPAVTLTVEDQGIRTKTATPVITYTATDINLASTNVKVDGTIITPTPASGAAMAKLADGLRTVRVEALDSAGNIGFKEVSLTIDTIVSPFTLNAVTAVSRAKTQTIGGTVEAGSTVKVALGTGVATAATVTGTTWSFPIAALAEGVNNIAVTATDTLGNTGALPAASIKVVLPDGKITGDAGVAIADALKSLQFATGLVTPTAEEAIHADVAPLVNGVPAPNDKVDVGDVVVILRKVVDPTSW